MNTYIIIAIIVGIILLLLIAIWFVRRYIKKRKARRVLLDKETGIPLETLEIFNEAERRLKEKGGINQDGNNPTPYEILWEIARERSRSSTGNTGVIQDTGVGRTIPANVTGDSNLQRDRELETRRSFQIQSDIDIAKDKRKPKTNWANFS